MAERRGDVSGLNHDAEFRVSAEMVEWTDAIFVMEPAHKKKLSKLFNGPSMESESSSLEFHLKRAEL